MTHMPWLKQDNSVYILLLNVNGCTSVLMFQAWKCVCLLSLCQGFSIPLFLEYLLFPFFQAVPLYPVS